VDCWFVTLEIVVCRTVLKDMRAILKAQAPNTQSEFEHRTDEVVVQFSQQFNVQLDVAVAAAICGGGGLVGMSVYKVLILKLWP
jgi:hypothetical protein